MAELKRRLFGGYTSESVEAVLSEKDALLNGASKSSSAAEQLERVSSQLAETQGRLAELEKQLAAAQELSATLTADLEGSVAQRLSLEAEVLPLRSELEEVRSAQASVEATGSQESLQRALVEAAEYKATVIAQQQRLAELEQLVEGYRELIDSGNAEALASAQSSGGQEPSGPASASELAAVIEVTEQAVANILDSTRVRADEELRAVEGQRERIGRDVESMTAWRDRAAPMIASLQTALDAIKSQSAEIGRGVDEALRPVSTAVAALTAQLASLDDLARAPVDHQQPPAPESEFDRVTVIPEEQPPSPDSPER